MVPQWIETIGTQDRRPVSCFVQVTPKLRTASPAEVDRPPHHEEPVSLANKYHVST